MEEGFLNIKIAVDFDGTIVEHKYPEIGAEIAFAFDSLKKMQERGCQLILWTFRAGRELQEAVDYCSRKGLEFYAVNKSYPEEKYDESISRKINADIFIDDRNLGGLPDWGAIWHMIDPDSPLHMQENADKYYTGGSVLQRLLNSFRSKNK